ncbi:MAG: hypothetical protein AAGH41_13175 [Pseudomonadota bacterium]
MILTSLALLAANAALFANDDYTVEILYQQKNGLRSRTVKVRDSVDFSDGAFELEDSDISEAPLLIGDVTIDDRRNSVRIDLTVCALGPDDCEEIASPTVVFTRGSRQRIRGETRSGVYYRITFRPE